MRSKKIKKTLEKIVNDCANMKGLEFDYQILVPLPDGGGEMVLCRCGEKLAAYCEYSSESITKLGDGKYRYCKRKRYLPEKYRQ